jgi:hypothetical protein
MHQVGDGPLCSPYAVPQGTALPGALQAKRTKQRNEDCSTHFMVVNRSLVVKHRT